MSAEKVYKKLTREEETYGIVAAISIISLIIATIIWFYLPATFQTVDLFFIIGSIITTSLGIAIALSANSQIEEWNFHHAKWRCVKCGSEDFIYTETLEFEPSLIDDNDSKIKRGSYVYSCAKCGAVIDTGKITPTFIPILNSIRYRCPKCGGGTFHSSYKEHVWLSTSGWHDGEYIGLELICARCGFNATDDYTELMQYITDRLGMNSSNTEEVKRRIESGEVKLAPIIAEYYARKETQDAPKIR